MIKTVVKRDGSVEAFNATKIAESLKRAISKVETADKISLKDIYMICDFIERTLPKSCPSERIQDEVEWLLTSNCYFNLGKAYILHGFKKQYGIVDQNDLDGWDLDEVDVEIVLMYANTNMNLAKTSRNCFCHPNTVRYHLRSVKKKTGLDPQHFRDLAKIVGAIERGAVK